MSGKCKTPLRYPGGKSRATKKLFEYLPNMSEITHYREGFLGGGSVAIAFTKKFPDIPVWVNDLYKPLYNFWVQLQRNGHQLSDILKEKKLAHNEPESAKDLFLECKSILTSWTADEIDLAAAFWVVNKCSFSGLTESSSFSKMASNGNFSLTGIENLHYYCDLIQKWKITNQCYSTLLTSDPQTLVYLDPPYDIKDVLYGRKGNMHKGFDHLQFAANCDANTAPTMISYNDDEWVRERYSGWEHHTFPLTYTMRSTGTYSKDQAGRLELVMCNYKLAHTNNPLDALLV